MRGIPNVTASFGTVRSITDSASLTFHQAGASSVAGDVSNFGGLLLDPSQTGDGGSLLTIGGTLYNHGYLLIGTSNGGLTAASTVEAGALLNHGSIHIFGSPAEATLHVDLPAGFDGAGIVTGVVDLENDALIEFASGQISTISGQLILGGSHAFVADASNPSSNSALEGLDAVTGSFRLDGATVTTSGALTNSGGISLDFGSVLNVKGALTNLRNIYVRDFSSLNCSDMFTNDGTVDLKSDDEKLVCPVSGTGDFLLARGADPKFREQRFERRDCDLRKNTRDKLILGQPSSFDGKIDDFFTKGDTVLAKGFDESATSFLYTQTGADSCSWSFHGGNAHVGAQLRRRALCAARFLDHCGEGHRGHGDQVRLIPFAEPVSGMTPLFLGGAQALERVVVWSRSSRQWQRLLRVGNQTVFRCAVRLLWVELISSPSRRRMAGLCA